MHTRIGVGGRMDTLQCAVVLAKLERFDWEIDRRIEIGGATTACSTQRGIEPRRPAQRPHQRLRAVHDPASTIATAFRARLKAAGIPTAVHYPVPLQRQPAYRDRCIAGGRCRSPERAAARVLSLPMHPYLEEEVQDRIVAELEKAVAGA